MSDYPPSRLAEFRRGTARYTPISRLAAGGMGEVWRGEACFPDGHVEEVAIKRVVPHLANNELYRSMLEDEARLGMLLRHPNIVRVYDARDQGSFILVMEYVEGRSLSQLLQGHLANQASLPVAVSLHVAREVARALEHAHNAIDELGRELHIIHGDLSPHNVLTSVHGDVKLMDFGLARASANHVVRDPNKLSGKWGYLAPELVLHREVSQLNDVFALGIVLWECLSGRRLFTARSYAESRDLLKHCAVVSPVHHNPAVTPEIARLTEVALAREPAQRFRSAAAFGAALDSIIETLEPGICAQQTADLVCKHLGIARKQRETARRPGLYSPAPSQGVLRLSDAELEDFFANCDTTVYQRITPSAVPPPPGLDAFVVECDTRLLRRPRDASPLL
ncbi:MAG: serine/threonine-protein kinase [Myxococcales bacterium]